MIVSMKKMTFLGLGDEKERFVKRLQELGIVHLDLPGESVLPADTARELQRVTEIRKFLSRISEKGGTTRDTEGDYSQICARREELGQKESRLSTEISALKKEQASLEPWGNFKPEDIALLRSRGLEVHFYRVSRKIFETLPLEGTLCEVLSGPTAGEAVFALFSAYAVNLEIPEEKLPAKSLADISAEIKAKETELAEISKAYIELSAKIAALEKAEADLTDIFEYRKALLNAGSELEDRLFVLKCWSPVPEDRLVESLGTDFKFVCLTEEPEPGDRVPVLLKNKPTFNSGEDLVKVYSHPNYSDFDPSGLVLYWFVVFYGMIIGDAGYGLTLLALNVFLHIKVKSSSDLWIRFRRLNYMLASSVIFFGVISVSYFGIAVPPESPLNKCMLLNFGTKEGQNFVMLVSIIMGMVHVSLALAIKCFRSKDWPSLGWIIIIWSGYALLTSNMVKGEENPTAQWIMIAGFALVILFTSSHKNIIIRLLLGVNGSLGVVQLFADILSYMRLFALGLATMYMCQTFNLLASLAYEALPPYIGFLPAILILVAGHSINIVLGIMGGVVHGLRLNFLEWYRWCFEGDGVPFKAFKLVALEKF